MNHHELPKIDDDGPKNENHIDMDDTDVKELARGGVRASIQQPLNKINNLGETIGPHILSQTHY